MNINSKFTGSGGSKTFHYLDSSSLAPKKPLSVPKPSVSGIFRADKFILIYSDVWAKLRSSENITSEEIFQLLSASKELLEK